MRVVTKGLYALGLGAALLLAGCGSDESEGEEVTLEFFSNKSENIDTYEALIEEFESQNPDINVKFESPPEANTIIKTRLTKNNLPDVMSLGGDAIFGEIARADVLHDFSGSEILDNVQNSYVDILGALVGSEYEGAYGIPYATNANAVIYNKEKVEELGIEIPETWDELINALEIAQEAGEIPIYYTLQETWTAMPLWNGVAGNLVPPDFAERKNEGETTFLEEYGLVADRALELLQYGHDNNFGYDYNDGNRAFANGEGVFYIQGNWVIPDILTYNPDADLGMFVLPVNETAEENELVSGVDVLLAVDDATEHKEEALKFVEFLTKAENAQQYIDEQHAFSGIQGVMQEDEVFEGINPYFEEDRLTSFPDHYYPIGMGGDNLIQEFYIYQNKEESLRELDEEWDKVYNR
ncbi:ABC transporter substrate-binding protein [Oceanobacillus oncorhynchi]|uniref:ABC transporter substrate-binding protein n=1 Tax=Oceanobacillus oncorhynchi TaxID=545501 RepID=UPI0025A42CEB|nr:extracellular solute-binding protein [Oceanobacillus oncorhynchi]MDM8098828.1 extracellular solute-binding protein [Oceanobacillus oncorhynchi]